MKWQNKSQEEEMEREERLKQFEAGIAASIEELRRQFDKQSIISGIIGALLMLAVSGYSLWVIDSLQDELRAATEDWEGAVIMQRVLMHFPVDAKVQGILDGTTPVEIYVYVEENMVELRAPGLTYTMDMRLIPGGTRVRHPIHLN